MSLSSRRTWASRNRSGRINNTRRRMTPQGRTRWSKSPESRTSTTGSLSACGGSSSPPDPHGAGRSCPRLRSAHSFVTFRPYAAANAISVLANPSNRVWPHVAVRQWPAPTRYSHSTSRLKDVEDDPFAADERSKRKKWMRQRASSLPPEHR